jgi:hypothetical protein
LKIKSTLENSDGIYHSAAFLELNLKIKSILEYSDTIYHFVVFFKLSLKIQSILGCSDAISLRFLELSLNLANQQSCTVYYNKYKCYNFSLYFISILLSYTCSHALFHLCFFISFCTCLTCDGLIHIFFFYFVILWTMFLPI